MSREVAEAAMRLVLAEARRTGTAPDLVFFGGEPLMEWELVQHCTEWMRNQDTHDLIAPVRFSLTTNCTLLSADKIAWLAEHDFKVGLSVDGSAAMHNVNRCYPDGRGSHSDVARTLERLRGYPELRTKVICVVAPNNVQWLSDGMAWLYEHYDGTIGINFDYWHEWSDAQFDILRDQYEKTLQLVLATYRADKPLRLSNFEEKVRSYLRGSGDVPCLHCRIGEQELAVSVDGTLFPCSRSVGDAEKLRFGDVWHGIDRRAQQRLIAARGNRTPECASCKLRFRCINSCGCSNYASTGHTNQVSPFQCSCEKLCIHAADSVAEILYSEGNKTFREMFYN